MGQEENKRLEQDLELLEQQIRETKSAIKGHSSASSHTPHPRAPPPLDTDEVGVFERSCSSVQSNYQLSLRHQLYDGWSKAINLGMRDPSPHYFAV